MGECTKEKYPEIIEGISPMIAMLNTLISSGHLQCTSTVLANNIWLSFESSLIFFYFLHSSCHKRFEQLDPEAVRINKNAKLASRKIMTLPELRVCFHTMN